MNQRRRALAAAGPEPASDASRSPWSAAPWTENRPSSRWAPGASLRELWTHRELAFFLALRDFKLRYAQTLLGAAWVVLQPLVAAAIFYGLFGKGLKVPSDGIPYFVFAYAGLALWSYVSTAVDAAAESLAAHSAMVTKVYFPRLIAPIAAALPGLVDLAIGLVLLAFIVAVNGVVPTAAVATLPLWVAGALATSVGIGVWLSALNAQYRDVRYALGFLLQVWFFASPVVYSSSVVDGGWRYVFAANPLVGVLDGFRWSTLAGPAPGAEDLVSLIVALMVLVTGLAHFRRIERRLADVI
jgi:homopolymeric O-antigen transport system permease protein